MDLAEHSSFTNNKLRRLQIKLNHNKSNQILVFGKKGKLEYLGKNLSEQSRESTDSAHIYDGASGNRTCVILVGGECTHHWAN